MTVCFLTVSISKLMSYIPDNTSIKKIKHTFPYTIVTFNNNSKYMIMYCGNRKPCITKHELKKASKCSGVVYVLKENDNDYKYILTSYDVLKKELDNHLQKTESIFCFRFKYYFYFTRLINAGVSI
jgi:hypothetical protein